MRNSGSLLFDTRLLIFKNILVEDKDSSNQIKEDNLTW